MKYAMKTTAADLTVEEGEVAGKGRRRPRDTRTSTLPDYFGQSDANQGEMKTLEEPTASEFNLAVCQHNSLVSSSGVKEERDRAVTHVRRIAKLKPRQPFEWEKLTEKMKTKIKSIIRQVFGSIGHSALPEDIRVEGRKKIRGGKKFSQYQLKLMMFYTLTEKDLETKTIESVLEV